MKIVYVGTDKFKAAKWRDSGETVMLLHFDNWDDYGNKTRFPTTFIHNSVDVEIGALRIQFANELRSHTYLKSRLEQGWNGEFPIDDTNYVSVPEEITFYDQLLGLFPLKEVQSVALALRDASYMAYVLSDPAAHELINSSGFSNSLQRERGSQKAFDDNWRLLQGQAFGVRDFAFQFRDVMGNISELKLQYGSDEVLPRDINVVIGPNGVGKSFMLRQMVHAWLEPDEESEDLNGARFSTRPNLSQLVAVSYSPFERLPVDVREQKLDHPLKDADVYRFFGFRGREGTLAGSKATRIRNNLSVPKANSARSLLDCLIDDRRFESMKDWARKLETLQSVVGSAIEFDFPALRLSPEAPADQILIDHGFRNTEIITIEEEDGETRHYVPIKTRVFDDLNLDALAEHVDADAGVTFFLNGAPLKLSSGQRLFFYIVVNVLGAIRRNSLILVDEPELFLHPTLEVQYIGMLKTLLRTYASKALIATHSVLVVREVPTDCVHIMERSADELVIKQPPFETFGGDVQRIASYVFGDQAVTKPFEHWLNKLLEKYVTADAVIEALGEDLNEEMIIQLHAMEQS